MWHWWPLGFIAGTSNLAQLLEMGEVDGWARTGNRAKYNVGRTQQRGAMVLKDTMAGSGRPRRPKAISTRKVPFFTRAGLPTLTGIPRSLRHQLGPRYNPQELEEVREVIRSVPFLIVMSLRMLFTSSPRKDPTFKIGQQFVLTGEPPKARPPPKGLSAAQKN
ncbi:hypothetical protein HDU85_003598 [Gaertneriomyces sp. JEL0708]|nr:hypothetical protein HDU85_003598 [Gaertneriomyces sp. JEL0708]